MNVLTRRSTLRPLTAAIALGAAIGAAGAWLSASHASIARTAVATSVAPKSVVIPAMQGATGCAIGSTSSTVGYAVKFASAGSLAALSAHGLGVTGAVSAPSGQEAFVEAQTSSGQPVSASMLNSQVGLQNATPVLAQSSDPQFRSCLSHLSNSRGDQQLMSDAGKAFVAAGSMTQTQLGTVIRWFVSDDPLDPSRKIVTADSPGPVLQVAAGLQPPGVALRAVVPHIAYVDPTTDAVSGLTVAPPTK